jgi:hypothetical protein
MHRDQAKDRLMTQAVASTLLAFTLMTAIASAQQKEQFVQAQQANTTALREYTWKRRTDLKLKGESKKVTMEQVRYDIDGKLEKTPIGGAPEQPPQEQPASGRGRRGGRVKQKVIENKKEEFAELMQKLGALAASYGQLPQDKLQAFAKNATVGKGEGAEAGTVRIQGGNVLVDGDSMSIWIDPVSYMMRRVEIGTSLEKKPVRLVSEYRSVDNGPTYQARAVLQYPDKQIELTIENFEYQHVAAAK